MVKSHHGTVLSHATVKSHHGTVLSHGTVLCHGTVLSHGTAGDRHVKEDLDGAQPKKWFLGDSI
jgi:hypothetical protein